MDRQDKIAHVRSVWSMSGDSYDAARILDRLEGMGYDWPTIEGFDLTDQCNALMSDTAAWVRHPGLGYDMRYASGVVVATIRDMHRTCRSGPRWGWWTVNRYGTEVDGVTHTLESARAAVRRAQLGL